MALQQHIFCTADASVAWSLAQTCPLQHVLQCGRDVVGGCHGAGAEPAPAPCSASSSSQKQLGLKALTLFVAMQIDDDIVFIQEGAIQALLTEKLTNDRCGQAAGLTAGEAKGLTASCMLPPYRSLSRACTGPPAN